MLHKFRLSSLMMVIAAILGSILQSCEIENGIDIQIPIPKPKPTVDLNDLNFTVNNLSEGGGKLEANGGIPVLQTVCLDIIINGELNTVTLTMKSNELPVKAGDEVEIRFKSSCPEQTEASFTMPDGKSHNATINAPTFKWTVPDNFTPGMQIKGESHYETHDGIYNRTGTVTLVKFD